MRILTRYNVYVIMKNMNKPTFLDGRPIPSADLNDPKYYKQSDAVEQWDVAYDRLDAQGQRSSSEIRDQLGPRPEEFLPAQLEQSLVFVDIEERALAIEAIVRYLNKASQVRGSKNYIDNGGASMKERYGSSLPNVQRGAEGNRDKLLGGFLQGISVLAATDRMRTAGYDEDIIEDERMAVQMAVNKHIGVGQTGASRRNRIKKNARQLADVVAGRKKPRSKRSS